MTQLRISELSFFFIWNGIHHIQPVKQRITPCDIFFVVLSLWQYLQMQLQLSQFFNQPKFLGNIISISSSFKVPSLFKDLYFLPRKSFSLYSVLRSVLLRCLAVSDIFLKFHRHGDSLARIWFLQTDNCIFYCTHIRQFFYNGYFFPV